MVVTYGGPFGEITGTSTPRSGRPILALGAAAADRRALAPAGQEPAGGGQHRLQRHRRQEGQRPRHPVSIGAHGQREGLGAHWDMWSFALGGMNPMDVLRTGDDQSGPRPRPRQGPRQPRARQARRPRGARRQPAREHPQLGQRVDDHGRRRLFDGNLQIVAGGTGGFRPFWFHEQAGGAFTAGSDGEVPHED